MSIKELGKRLAARLDEGDWNYIEPFISETEREISTLKAQLAEAEKDAGRYRWLLCESERIYPMAAIVWKRNQDRNESEWVNSVSPKGIDSLIDAAIKEQS